MESVNEVLKELFPRGRFYRISTHEKIKLGDIKKLSCSDTLLVGGTNLLSSNMNQYNQWKINLFDSLYFRNAVLFGVGWWQYQSPPNNYTKLLLKIILSKNLLHSVRDSYTLNQLNSAGIHNAINTGCPTLWGIDSRHCERIPRSKAENVLFTLTDYNIDENRDKKIFRILQKNYKKIYFWPQGLKDADYAGKIGVKAIIMDSGLESLKKLLFSDIKLDYIGTRLHAGILSIRNFRRSVIIGIDNRAVEIKKDFNLNVVEKSEFGLLEKIISFDLRTDLKIPHKNINKWKKQFFPRN